VHQVPCAAHAAIGLGDPKILDGHLVPTFGALRLVDITPVRVRQWHADPATGPTRRAHAYAYALLRTILNTAVADDAISSNPCRVRGAGVTKRARKIVPATFAELDVIVDAMPGQYRAAVLIAAGAACGSRRSPRYAAATSTSITRRCGHAAP
jgi:hypothetical protein